MRTAILVSCLFAATALAADSVPIPGELLISLEPGRTLTVTGRAGAPRTGLADLDAVLAAHDVTVLEPMFGEMLAAFDDPATRQDLARHYFARHASKAGDAALIRDLEALPAVAEVARNTRHASLGNAYVPNDLFDIQWYLRNPAIGQADTRALGGWAESLGDSNVVVAVLDSGIDYRHPDLGGSGPNYARGAIWMNWEEYHGTPGVDDDANGRVDDVRGWDFINEPLGNVWPGEDPGPPDNDPMDFGGHGTNCAGCVSPLTDNGTGIAATAPGCKIMAVRIGWLSSDGNGYSNANYMAQGFVYATANGADIINLSYGTGYTGPFQSAIQAALNAGVVICTAAGNDNVDNAGYLQGYNDDRVLVVAATNSGDGKADFSNFGSWVDLSAPGVNIYTTSYQPAGDIHGYASVQGTSFSSPITAGACALIWSAHPEFTSAEVAALVQATCDPIDQLNPGYEGLLGAGRVNLLRALGDNVQLVPQEFVLLRDALNQAAPGDTVKVLATQPLDAVTLLGKSLKIYGAYAADYVGRDPLGTPTVITGTAAGPALQFFGGADNTCVVDGFRVQGGGGRFFADAPYGGQYGGGIVLDRVSPTLRNLHVTGNAVGSPSQLGLGGGISMRDADAVLENVRVEGNTGIYGAGVFVYQGQPTFTACQIVDNVVLTTNGTYPAKGGGLHVLDAAPVLNDCVISGHAGAEEGGGIYAAGYTTSSDLEVNGGAVTGNSAKTKGGGITHRGGGLTMSGTEVSGNTLLPTSTLMGGGGIFATNAAVTLSTLTVVDNDAHAGGGVQLTACPDAYISECLFAGNSAVYWAGALSLENSAGVVLENLTVADNTAAIGGAGIHASAGSATISHTIAAFNTGGASMGNGIHAQGAALTLTCNDVFGNASPEYGGVTDPTGTGGNIAADPLFCAPAEGDYGIATSSPAAPPQSPCGLMGAFAAGCGGTPVEEGPGTPLAFRVEPNFPNPFNPSTTIRFSLPAAARTTVTVYDVAGRPVKTLLDDNLAAATHTLQWRGDDGDGRSVAAGVYFYRVRSGAHEHVGRMALLK